MAAGDAAQLQDLPIYIGNVLQAMIPLIGLIAFIMVIKGGFTILTSAGDHKGLQSGRQTITLAIAGLALAIISWLILVFIKNVTGVDVTNFKFGF